MLYYFQVTKLPLSILHFYTNLLIVNVVLFSSYKIAIVNLAFLQTYLLSILRCFQVTNFVNLVFLQTYLVPILHHL